ncbi:MAG: hypothetical protein ACX98W_10385 [bacterium]
MRMNEARQRQIPAGARRNAVGRLAWAIGLGLFALMLGGCDGDSGSAGSSFRERPDAPALWGDAGEIEEILLEPDALVRAERLGRRLGSLAPSALEDVLSAYDAVFLDVGDFELELLAEWWARFDPEAAYAWTKEEWRASHPLVGQAVLRAWARVDPEAALRAAEQEALFSVRRPAVGAVLQGWQEGGHPGSFEYVESLPPGHDRQRYLSYVARRKVLRDGVESTLEWAESQPDEPRELKLNLFRRVASAVGEVDPERAAAWVESQLGGPFGDQLPQRLGVRWVAREPEAAMQWFSTLPKSHDREMGLQETYRRWLRLDKPAAQEWMAGQERAEWLDPARALYAMSRFRDDLDQPVAAIEEALSIEDQALRWPTLGRIWRVWYFRAPEEAEAWFVSNQEQIPEFYRERIPTIPSGMLKASGADLPSFLESDSSESSEAEADSDLDQTEGPAGA